MKDNPEGSWSKVQFSGEVKDTPAANSPPLSLTDTESLNCT